MKIVITGATGYIGGCLVNLALKRGYDVVAASRHRPIVSASCWMPFELFSEDVVVLPPGTKAVIHLAADTSSDAGDDGEREVLAGRSLVRAAQQIDAKFVFVSSQTARPDAPTPYGRTKWRIEQEVLSVGAWVVRPGQVYGGCERGMFGTLVGAVRQLPVLPAFLPAPNVQPIHIDDLAEGLLRIIERNDVPPGVLRLASSNPVSFTQFLLAIASDRVHRQRWFMPVPIMFVKLINTILGSRLRKQLGLERLNSLFDLPLMDSNDDLSKLGLSLRSLSSGMHSSGDSRRRRLICEGQAMLTYVLKERPGSILIRRYVRAVEMLRAGSPIDLPRFALKLPAFIALLDERNFTASVQQGEEFFWRLNAATALAEASTRGAYRFLGLGRNSGLLMSLLCIVDATVREIIWRILRIAIMPFWRWF